jgi:hypothetical protein
MYYVKNKESQTPTSAKNKNLDVTSPIDPPDPNPRATRASHCLTGMPAPPPIQLTQVLREEQVLPALVAAVVVYLYLYTAASSTHLLLYVKHILYTYAVHTYPQVLRQEQVRQGL